MKIINLCPHPIKLRRGDGSIEILPIHKEPARLNCQSKKIGEIDGIPIVRNYFHGVRRMPGQIPGTIYIVSPVIAKQFPDRMDIFYPAGFTRDENGRHDVATALGKSSPNDPTFSP